MRPRPDDRRARLALVALWAVWSAHLGKDALARDAFSWMDPEQYFRLAAGLLDGSERYAAFPVASVFPFLLAPFVAVARALPVALWVNAAAVALLLAAVGRLRRDLGLATPAPAVGALVLASPLLLGLSRTLYSELALAAVVAAGFACWLAVEGRGRGGGGWVLGAAVGAAFLVKMTAVAFFAAPALGAAVAALWRRRWRRAGAMAAGLGAPVVALVALHGWRFPGPFAYYRSLGNTRIPVMASLGPPELLSWRSIGYTPRTLAVAGLGVLWLALAFAVAAALVAAWRGWRPRGAVGLVALWLLGPLVAFALTPVKEPRHLAPCVVAAVLLLVAGVEAALGPRARRAVVAVALLGAGAQYLLVASGRWFAPYYLRRPLHAAAVRAAVAPAGDASPSPLGSLLAAYPRGVALAGFDANEALALTWALFPAVTVDLDLTASGALPRRFEDPFLLTAFDSYNQRCGWHRRAAPLDRGQALRNADALVTRGAPPPDAEAFRGVTPIAVGDGVSVRLHPPGPQRPYRAVVAQRFLAEGLAGTPVERRTVGFELLVTAAAAGDGAGVRAAAAAFDPLAGERRNVYWIGAYGPLHRLALERARGWLASSAEPAAR